MTDETIKQINMFLTWARRESSLEFTVVDWSLELSVIMLSKGEVQFLKEDFYSTLPRLWKALEEYLLKIKEPSISLPLVRGLIKPGETS